MPCRLQQFVSSSEIIRHALDRLSFLLTALFEHLLHDLLLFDQESAHYPILYAVGTARTTIGTLDSFLGTGNGGIFAGTECRNACKFYSTITALYWRAALFDVEISESTAGSLDYADVV